MTNAQQLTEARANAVTARAAYEAAKFGTKAWRKAAEELEFWTNKAAMLTVMVGRDFS